MKSLTIGDCQYHPRAIQSAFDTLGDFERYFESFFGDSVLAPAAGIFNRAVSGSAPSVDIRETGDTYVLDMELPGYDEKNIEVHLDGSKLAITSRQEEKQEDGSARDDGKYILRERRINSFNRSFKLPENADPETVSAAFKNGILTLQIKKRAEAQKKVIQINAA